MAIATGDTDKLVGTVQKWSNTPAIVSEMGMQARAMLDAHYTRRQALARWRELLNQ